ncbi:type II secretion system F family protein [Roseateles asaccharophilus]|uniref:General secretion pathway protein F n=1 Tax=Roseateles asaccharophilus TaxID=582607 RepID=A0ABU2ABZ4_9BURK|nr:type II secretion system F family protein [Roseateles asaccharophilus]MDR7334718.1 general secretion pathway protein F [Roseateles asaccharophilus]
MRFDYQARDTSGRPHSGHLEARDTADAMEQLAAQGLTPVQLKTQEARRPVRRQRLASIKLADQVVLLRELATLLAAGVALGDALYSLVQAYDQQALGPAMAAMEAHVRGGGRLSDALRTEQLGMPSYVIALTQAGEASGELAQSLQDAADQMELSRKAGEDLRSALIYPSVLVGAGSLAVFFIFVGVVPKFASLIRGSRQVPDLSRWVIESGVFVRAHLFEALLLLGLLVAGVVTALARPSVRHGLLQFLQRVPVVGPWLVQAEIGRWATVLGALLANRVPVLTAMQLAQGVLRLDALKMGLERAMKGLQQGQTLSDGLATQAWFPKTRLNLIRVGERSGELPRMLQALGRTQGEAAALLQKRMLGLIEPIAILLIGAVIGVVMVAVMMAITSFDTLI